MIENRYYHDMEIYTVENLRDVFEYAFVDCPMKQQYLDKLLPLTKDGKSSARKIEPPVEHHYGESQPAAVQEPPAEPPAEPVEPVVVPDAGPEKSEHITPVPSPQ